jgi:hypothetical protein
LSTTLFKKIDMQRRIFMGISALGAVAIGFPYLYSCNSRRDEESPWWPFFLSRILDQQSIIETGRAYFKKEPAEQDRKKLEELLLMNSKTNSPEPDQLRQLFDNSVREDFENGRMIILKGWVLSITEARQCALFSLTHS